jgi:hypothetical protein
MSGGLSFLYLKMNADGMATNYYSKIFLKINIRGNEYVEGNCIPS